MTKIGFKQISTIIVISFTLLCLLCPTGNAAKTTYQPTMESLKQHSDAPEWFRDAKIGIYFHWGPYSVPAYGTEWYPRNMHDKKHDVYKHHVETYGQPTEFGYHDFVPMFKAEKFDPKKWAALFKKAGARFAGPVAEHHDGFAMWDSKLTPWNAVDKGPHRDIVGELEKAIKKQDMRFITTFHHDRNNLWQKPGSKKWLGHYSFVKTNFPSILDNPENAFMYGYMPRDKFVEMWRDKLIEVIDNYHPDIIWFDSWLDELPEKARFEFAAHYFNDAQKQGKEVVIVRKQDDMPIDFSVLDLEKSRQSDDSPRIWMTDDTISTGSWSYTTNLKIKPASQVIHALIDTVSKNGIVLLNISPMADGTIPDNQQNVLLELGHWLKTNGQAIYDTRPWITYGQGPTKEPQGGFADRQKFLDIQYSTKDIRYTASKDGKTVYAIALGKPQPDEQISLEAFNAKTSGIKVKKVTMLGSKEKIKFRQTGDGLVITSPAKIDQETAVAFKIEIK